MIGFSLLFLFFMLTNYLNKLKNSSSIVGKMALAVYSEE